jgi:hypothetical protein
MIDLEFYRQTFGEKGYKALLLLRSIIYYSAILREKDRMVQFYDKRVALKAFEAAILSFCSGKKIVSNSIQKTQNQVEFSHRLERAIEKTKKLSRFEKEAIGWLIGLKRPKSGRDPWKTILEAEWEDIIDTGNFVNSQIEKNVLPRLDSRLKKISKEIGRYFKYFLEKESF